METHLELLPNLPSKKLEVELANQLISLVENGECSVKEMSAKINFISKVIKKVEDEIKESLMDNINLYARGERIVESNTLFTPCEVGISYDYENCNHEEYNEICKKKKEIETFLKALKQPVTIVSEVTGEIVTIHPPIKKSTSSVKRTYL
jgi:hypothetical protein